jgi:hypothetical protein
MASNLVAVSMERVKKLHVRAYRDGEKFFLLVWEGKIEIKAGKLCKGM